MVKKNCGCVNMTLYGLPCAYILSMKICNKRLIRLGEMDPSWQRLRIGEEENEEGFSVMDECIGIEERIKKAPYKMKLHTMKIMHQLAFP